MKLEDRITTAFMEGTKTLLKEIFRESQQNVPVKSGDLKRSGRIVFSSGGGQIIYTSDHADTVENGYPEHVQTVSEHTRKARKYKIPVRAVSATSATTKRTPRYHWKTTAESRVQSYTRRMPAREGTHFLSNAVETVLDRLDKVMKDKLENSR